MTWCGLRKAAIGYSNSYSRPGAALSGLRGCRSPRRRVRGTLFAFVFAVSRTLPSQPDLRSAQHGVDSQTGSDRAWEFVFNLVSMWPRRVTIRSLRFRAEDVTLAGSPRGDRRAFPPASGREAPGRSVRGYSGVPMPLRPARRPRTCQRAGGSKTPLGRCGGFALLSRSARGVAV